jgi:hypothetical protein
MVASEMIRLTVLTWLIGLGAVVFLWRRESTEFFKPQRLM